MMLLIVSIGEITISEIVFGTNLGSFKFSIRAGIEIFERGATLSADRFLGVDYILFTAYMF